MAANARLRFVASFGRSRGCVVLDHRDWRWSDLLAVVAFDKVAQRQSCRLTCWCFHAERTTRCAHQDGATNHLEFLIGESHDTWVLGLRVWWLEMGEFVVKLDCRDVESLLPACWDGGLAVAWRWLGGGVLGETPGRCRAGDLVARSCRVKSTLGCCFDPSTKGGLSIQRKPTCWLSPPHNSSDQSTA